jgi:hypothetical protein
LQASEQLFADDWLNVHPPNPATPKSSAVRDAETGRTHRSVEESITYA